MEDENPSHVENENPSLVEASDTSPSGVPLEVRAEKVVRWEGAKLRARMDDQVIEAGKRRVLF